MTKFFPLVLIHYLLSSWEYKAWAWKHHFHSGSSYPSFWSWRTPTWYKTSVLPGWYTQSQGQSYRHYFLPSYKTHQTTSAQSSISDTPSIPLTSQCTPFSGLLCRNYLLCTRWFHPCNRPLLSVGASLLKSSCMCRLSMARLVIYAGCRLSSPATFTLKMFEVTLRLSCWVTFFILCFWLGAFTG